jgi:hypothetical protein
MEPALSGARRVLSPETRKSLPQLYLTKEFSAFFEITAKIPPAVKPAA